MHTTPPPLSEVVAGILILAFAFALFFGLYAFEELVMVLAGLLS